MQARATLEREYTSLLALGTDRRIDEVILTHTHTHASPPSWLTSAPLQDDDKNFRRAPSWRKKFRPKDTRGASLGAADTLPANFRVTGNSSASPSMQPKRSAMDGKLAAVTAAAALHTAHVHVHVL